MAKFDLGFLGGGQLARMSIQAAQRMGLTCLSLDPGAVTPASQIAPALHGNLSDPTKIAEVLGSCERITLENEFIPADAIRKALAISKRHEDCIVPGIETLATIQDKLTQRQALERAHVPSPHAVPLDDEGARARDEIGFPMVLKARFGGYDGKGTRYARTEAEFESYRDLWSAGGWLAEAFVPFKRELAVMVYRYGSTEGVFRTVETVQTKHVCDLVFPCDADASAVALAAIRAVEGEGLYGVELFECEDGTILVNEIAPRPHNSGHYTMDGWSASQFQAHVAAVTGLTMPELVEYRPVIMANLLGQEGAGDWRAGVRALEAPDARFHWYGKEESRPGRKMGHLNVLGDDPWAESTRERAVLLRDLFYQSWIADGLRLQ